MEGAVESKEEEEKVEECFKLKRKLESLKKEYQKFVMHPAYSVPFLQTGRLVKVGEGWGWGVCVAFNKKGKGEDVVVDVLVKANTCLPHKPRPFKEGEKGEWVVMGFGLELLVELSSIRLNMPHNMVPSSSRASVGSSLEQVKSKFKEGFPLLDPRVDQGISDPSFLSLLQTILSLEKLVFEKWRSGGEEMERKVKKYGEKEEKREKVRQLKKRVKKSGEIVMGEELNKMYRVLRRLNFLDSKNVIQTKGRVACEIFATHSLLLTEMLFHGLFNELTVEQSVALLSCFVFEEKTQETVQLKQTLSKPLRQLQELAKRIATVCKECKLEIDVNEYVEQFEPSMMDVVYKWVTGAKFSEICKLTSIFEGSIIRCMRRLEELLRQLSQASKAIGNSELESKFSEGILKIKRDIVFAASLYI